MSSPFVGVVTGWTAEARCLPPRWAGTAIIWRCSGARSENARRAAQILTAEGAMRLVSFGIAGGLDPALAPGHIVIAESVIIPGGERFATDPDDRARLVAALSQRGVPATALVVAGVDHAITTPEDKATLRRRTGAAACDMESHGVAVAARAAGLPFTVCRAVADPAGRSLPRAAFVGLTPTGESDPWALVAALLMRPTDLWNVIRLGRDSRRALGALRRLRALGLL